METKILKTVLVFILLIGLITGCAHMTTQQQRVLSGGAIGAGAGAAFSAITGGSVLGGAAIGGAAGAVGGYVYNQSKRGH